MADRETVIYDIGRCICHVPDACKDCSKYVGDNAIRCMEELLADALTLLKAQEPGWISVKDAMPSERETIFAKFKGTNKWNPAMFATSSEDVRVVVQFEDGTRKVWHDHTMDGKWKSEKEKYAYPKRTVTHWMPNPDLPEEET